MASSGARAMSPASSPPSPQPPFLPTLPVLGRLTLPTLTGPFLPSQDPLLDLGGGQFLSGTLGFGLCPATPPNLPPSLFSCSLKTHLNLKSLSAIFSHLPMTWDTPPHAPGRGENNNAIYSKAQNSDDLREPRET